MLKLRERVNYDPISVGTFDNNLISKSDSEPRDPPVWRLAYTQKRSQLLKTITLEDSFDVPVNNDYLWDCSYTDFSKNNNCYILRPNGIRYAVNTLFFPSVSDCAEVVYQARSIPPTVIEISIEAVFEGLYEKWSEQTKYESFIGISTNGYHESIIKLGRRVVPYIINKLRKEPVHLFVALCEITGENPVKEENRGKVRKMAEDWIQWWEKKGREMG